MREFNLSYKCLTSYAAREQLQNLKKTNLAFFKELTKDLPIVDVQENEVVLEDSADDDIIIFEGDSDLPCQAIIA